MLARESYPVAPYMRDVRVKALDMAANGFHETLTVLPLPLTARTGTMRFGADGAYINGVILAGLGFLAIAAYRSAGVVPRVVANTLAAIRAAQTWAPKSGLGEDRAIRVMSRSLNCK